MDSILIKYKNNCHEISSVRFLALLFLAILLFQIDPAIGQKKDRPNVILILADDMGVGDIALHNGGLNRTPNLDRLIRKSVWFNQGYSGSAVCAPARATLLTGRYPHRTGVTGLDLENFPTMTSLGKKEVTLANVFADNGYRTGLIGKWHLGKRAEYHPMKRGFEEYIGFMGAFDIDTYFKFKLDVNGEYKRYDGPYLTDVLTDSAVSFVNKHKDSPFFLHLAYYAPHRPLSAPADLVTYYKSKGFDQKTAQVYAMIEIMDKGIGQVVNELDRLGIRENTIIIFASDNGPDPVVRARFNQDLKGSKYTAYEGGIRVPLLFNWKNKLAPKEYRKVFHFVDIFPTIFQLCDIDLQGHIAERLDGDNVGKELMEGKEKQGKVVRYWQWNRGRPYYTHNAAIREGAWKLIFPPVTSKDVNKESSLAPVLFNLKNDPTESTDVSAKHQGVYNRLKIMLEDWSEKMEANRLETTSFDN